MKSLKGKILSGFMVVIGLVILMGVSIYMSIHIMNEKTATVIDEELPLLQTAQDLNLNITERTSVARGYLLYGQKGYRTLYDFYTVEGKKLEAELLKMSPTKNTKEAIKLLHEWENLLDEHVINVYATGNRDLARSNFRIEVETAGQKVTNAFVAMTNDYAEKIRKGSNEVIQSGSTTALISMGIVAVTVVLGLIVAVYMANSLSRPIVRVANRMKLIASGDLTHDDLKTRSKDEVGMLIQSVNEMNKQIKMMAREIGDVSETVTRQSGELSEAAMEVNKGTRQVAATMEQLSEASESQANSTTELAEAMSVFSLNIQDASDHGQKANDISREVLQLTEKGNEAMTESIEKMRMIDENVRKAVSRVGKLDGHSKQITQLVSVISDIAEQTNLLALNAAIEAARAGEHGKGFAVVAGEVKKLAEQVASSVMNISGIVSTIQKETGEVVQSLNESFKQVEAGTGQIKSTGTAFELITSSVQQVVESIQLISDDLEMIVDRTETMNTSISNIASVSEEASAGIEETAASSEQATSSMQEIASNAEALSHVAVNLDKLIRRFKV